MFLKGFRWPIALIVTVLSVGVLFAVQGTGGWLMRGGLEDKLKTDPAVDSVKIDYGSQGKVVVSARLSPVDDLSQAYQRLDRTLADSLGDGAYLLKVEDRRGPAVETVYEEIHYALYEGMSTGRYDAMHRRINELVEPKRLDQWRVTVDQRHVFVQLREGRNYLYEILERPRPGPDGSTSPVSEAGIGRLGQ
ncbi:MAG: hypothetical protein HYY09_07885 [Firmicutes bacterium]|nr:hypothetical protein [Bacillota bacterium]